MRDEERAHDGESRDPHDGMGYPTMAEQRKSTRERIEENVRIGERSGERRCDDILEPLSAEQTEAEQVRE
jgi:hypothetical protein